MSIVVNDYVNHLVDYHHVIPRSTSSATVSTPISYFGFPVPNICYGHGWSSEKQVSIFSGDLGHIRQFTLADREDQRQTNAAVLGGLATVLLAGLTACALKQGQGNSKELARAKVALQDLKSEPVTSKSIALKPILAKHIEILESKCVRARHITFFAVSLLATAAAAFTSGMFAISWLVTASTVAGVALTALAAFAIVWHYDDETSLPPAMQRELRILAG